MKIALPERSLLVKDKLDNITQEILAIGKNKIAMIVLFGSYARGDWVRDVYKREHVTYSYQSDLDIMLVLRKEKYGGYKAIDLQHKIEKRLERKLAIDIMKEPSVTLVLEPIGTVNKQLEKGQYFFSDIRKEGVLLYDSGEFELAEAKELPWEERNQIAKEDFEQWFGRGKGFYTTSKYQLEIDEYALSAFSLHQATESFYNAILLVFAGYKRKSHDILDLSKKVRNYHYDLFNVFPYETVEQKECFSLLRNAYIDARYDKHYKISKEQLVYLTSRVAELKRVTEKICLEWINRKF